MQEDYNMQDHSQYVINSIQIILFISLLFYILVNHRMNKRSRVIQRPRKTKTQNQIIFNDHLEVALPEIFPNRLQKDTQSLNKQLTSPIHSHQTNFNFKTTNQFSFILLHLRNYGFNNPINVEIPEICIFHDKMPYDIIFYDKGYIRSYRNIEDRKVKLKDIYSTFKSKWKINLKSQYAMACFSSYITVNNKIQKQYLMLSDNDFYISCVKSRKDPFFNHLQYLQNKLDAEQLQPIKIQYIAEVQIQLIRLATESMMGIKEQAEIAQSLSQETYLGFLNEKISLFLNYQHNIRLTRAEFHYSKLNDNRYVLVNVKNIQYTNLTKALKQRQMRLIKQQQQKDKIIIITPRREEKYKHYQTQCSQTIQNYQKLMGNTFQNLMERYQLHSVQDKRHIKLRNQFAFKKIFKTNQTLESFTQSPNFHKKFKRYIRRRNYTNSAYADSFKLQKKLQLIRQSF